MNVIICALSFNFSCKLYMCVTVAELPIRRWLRSFAHVTQKTGVRAQSRRAPTDHIRCGRRLWGWAASPFSLDSVCYVRSWSKAGTERRSATPRYNAGLQKSSGRKNLQLSPSPVTFGGYGTTFLWASGDLEGVLLPLYPTVGSGRIGSGRVTHSQLGNNPLWDCERTCERG